MNDPELFPSYVARPEEALIKTHLARVRAGRESHVLMLYGAGGIGKTFLVRAMAKAGGRDEAVVWLDPIDVDDSAYWLLSRLEQQVADQLDPHNSYFRLYREYLARLPEHMRPGSGREAVVSRLSQIKTVFVDCYTTFVNTSGKSVVIAFDTVEALRGTYLLVTLVQWMKELPGTLFILSGRPVSERGRNPDPIVVECKSRHRSLEVSAVSLREFSHETALQYLSDSGVGQGLSPAEKEKLVHLTRGHPLWLAATVSYLDSRGMPEEADEPLEYIAHILPLAEPATVDGARLHEAFKRRLVTPYRETDFWHEAVNRLAVLRQAVNEDVWRAVMEGRRLPDGIASLTTAWRELLRMPWIRPRANGRYVTLHDAMAEELANRVIPLQDRNQRWQRGLWEQATDIYSEFIHVREPRLKESQADLDERLDDIEWPGRAGQGAPGERSVPAADQAELIKQVTEFDVSKRELDQFQAAGLFYKLLAEPAEGCEIFLRLFAEARRTDDFYSQELLALEMHRFLPDSAGRHTLDDTVGKEIEKFRTWLPAERPDLYREIGIAIADFLLIDERPDLVTDLLGNLPMTDADADQRYRVSNLLGNAFMRTPGQVSRGEQHFRDALGEAQLVTSHDRQSGLAHAYKELGFYYRNRGMWKRADEEYLNARDSIYDARSIRPSDEVFEEMASIYTNWAYVKALSGSYRDGSTLAELAIATRHRLGKYYDEGISWSVRGEVYRYERKFQNAWGAYAVAEQIFHGNRSWTWLGVIYQEQAICLFQAYEDDVNLLPDGDSLAEARRLIDLALDICRDQAIRNYPSALNRAGRIHAAHDAQAGLAYLAEGIEWARKLADGWFWLANLIEYVELLYQAEEPDYASLIDSRAPEIAQAMEEVDFPDLRGRWLLMQGHLAVHGYRDTNDEHQLGAALNFYKEGFSLLAGETAGSSGVYVLHKHFTTFSELFGQLTPEKRVRWRDELSSAWSGSTTLLASLEVLPA